MRQNRRQIESEADEIFAYHERNQIGDMIGLEDEPTKVLAHGGATTGESTIPSTSDNPVRQTQNVYELAGRRKKAMALVAILRRYKISAEMAGRMTPGLWERVATAAEVKMPSAETQAMVLAELQKAEGKV